MNDDKAPDIIVTGYDQTARKTVTCRQCSAILSYLPKAVKTESFTCMGERDSHEYIECPCGNHVTVRR